MCLQRSARSSLVWPIEIIIFSKHRGQRDKFALDFLEEDPHKIFRVRSSNSFLQRLRPQAPLTFCQQFTCWRSTVQPSKDILPSRHEAHAIRRRFHSFSKKADNSCSPKWGICGALKSFSATTRRTSFRACHKYLRFLTQPSASCSRFSRIEWIEKINPKTRILKWVK